MKAEVKQQETVHVEPAEVSVGAALEQIHQAYGGDLASFFQTLRNRQAKETQKRDREFMEIQYPDVALSRLVKNQ